MRSMAIFNATKEMISEAANTVIAMVLASNGRTMSGYISEASFRKKVRHTVIINNYFYASWSKLVGDVLSFLVSVQGITDQSAKSETTTTTPPARTSKSSGYSVLPIHLKVELGCNNAHYCQQGHNDESSPSQRQLIRHSSLRRVSGMRGRKWA